jgi:hypothetical protein
LNGDLKIGLIQIMYLSSHKKRYKGHLTKPQIYVKPTPVASVVNIANEGAVYGLSTSVNMLYFICSFTILRKHAATVFVKLKRVRLGGRRAGVAQLVRA